MNSDIFQYIVIISISGVLSILLGVFAYIRRKAFAGSTTFMLISLFSAFYTFGHAFELTSDSLEEIIYWIKFQYIGMPFIAPLSLVLVMYYIGLEKYLSRKHLAGLFLLPLTTTLLVLTNEYHQLFYKSYTFRTDTTSLLVDFEVGFWYIIHGSYTFGTLFLATCILVWHWNQAKAAYWKQLMTMLLGLIIPIVASFLYLIGKAPFGMDPVPMVMCITSLLYIIAIFSNDMFVIAPIAKERVFESMRDGVLVLDKVGKLVDYNKAASQMFVGLNHTIIGQSWNTLLKEELEDLPVWNEEDNYLGIHKWKSAERFYQVQSSPVYKINGKWAGRTIILSDMTEEFLLKERLKELAFKDGLTGIYNRTFFMEKVRELLYGETETDHPLTILLFDIDYFKRINDCYGHLVGDEALRHVCSIVQKHLRKEDLFARYGGEEFILCMPKISIQEAGEIAEKLRANIESNILLTSSDKITITASFGVAQYKGPKHTLQALLHEADQALYTSKRNGRNTIHFST
jgi:diguanylate cyclase (GGDEF)-like protein